MGHAFPKRLCVVLPWNDVELGSAGPIASSCVASPENSALTWGWQGWSAS